LFLALVALAVTMVEHIPELAADEPTVVRHDDEMVLQFGTVPEKNAPPRDLEQQRSKQRSQPAPRRDGGGDGASSGEWYVIQRGDTLSSIALERLGDVSLADDLALLNGLEDPDDLRPGDRIRLR
jgi:nucleoid-associated protein YgaU